MENSGEICSVCQGNLPKKARRKVLPDTFQCKDVFCEVLGIHRSDITGKHYVCSQCFNKLNKLSKINFDLENRTDILKQEKQTVLRDLRRNISAPSASQGCGILRSPKKFTPWAQLSSSRVAAMDVSMDTSFSGFSSSTPVKPKKRQEAIVQYPIGLGASIASSVVPGCNVSPVKGNKRQRQNEENPSGVRIGLLSSSVFAGNTTPLKGKKRPKALMHTPTPRKFKSRTLSDPSLPKLPKNKERPGAVKLLYQESEVRQRARIIKDAPLQRVVKSLIRGAQPGTIARQIFLIPRLRTELQQCFFNVVNKECTALCSTKEPSALRTGKLQELNYDDIEKDTKTRSPTLYNIITTATKNGDSCSTIVCAAVMMKNRNKHMSRVPHVIAQMLDHAGATDEVIDTLAKVGICVSSCSMSEKRRQLVLAQEEKIANVLKEVKQKELAFEVEKSVNVLNTMNVHGAGDCVQDSKMLHCENQTVLPEMTFATDHKLIKFPEVLYGSGFCESNEPFVVTSDAPHKTCSVTYSTTIASIGSFPEGKKCALQEEVVQTKVGPITFPEVAYASGYNRHMHSTSLALQSSTKKYLAEFVEGSKPQLDVWLPTMDIIGDNVDLMKSPSHMTHERQRESIHWFLNVGITRRVSSELPDKEPQANLSEIDNIEFLPKQEDCAAFDQNCIYHLVKVIVKNIGCLHKYADSVPEHITHQHLMETSQKSTVVLLDLLDKNENKSNDMISIMQDIHAKYIARTDEEAPQILERKVFGGDVLTTERSFASQKAMMNSQNGFYALCGVTPRPEGLHRMMNYLMV